jgi:hypothetical protein
MSHIYTPRPSAARIPTAVGLGLRAGHQQQVLDERPPVAWFEIHPENLMRDYGARQHTMDLRRDYPFSFHAVGLSLASADGVDAAHLAALADLVDQFEPGLVSDHLSWSTSGGVFLPELMGFPYTPEALDICVRNIDVVQTALKRTLLIENPSHYLGFDHATMGEPAFLAALVQRTGCRVVLDLNNIEVSGHNLGVNPEDMLASYIRDLPRDAVAEMHLAGHTIITLDDGSDLRMDTHSAPVSDPVMGLYQRALDHFGACPTLVEWDQDLPPFETLQAEAARAQVVMDGVRVDA